MKRRDFLLIGAGTLLASKSVQAARKVSRIGFMASGSRDLSLNLLHAFLVAWTSSVGPETVI